MMKIDSDKLLNIIRSLNINNIICITPCDSILNIVAELFKDIRFNVKITNNYEKIKVFLDYKKDTSKISGNNNVILFNYNYELYNKLYDEYDHFSTIFVYPKTDGDKDMLKKSVKYANIIKAKTDDEYMVMLL